MAIVVCYPVSVEVDGEVTNMGEIRVFAEDGEELLTTADAAADLELSRSTLQTLIQKGTIRVERLDERTVLIRRSEVERYRRESLGRPGRKAKGPQTPATASRHGQTRTPNRKE